MAQLGCEVNHHPQSWTAEANADVVLRRTAQVEGTIQLGKL